VRTLTEVTSHIGLYTAVRPARGKHLPVYLEHKFYIHTRGIQLPVTLP